MVLLDVRGADEFASGHIEGAVNISHDQVAGRLSELDKSVPIHVFCKMGGRAQMAGQVLAAAGFDVHCVVGGGMALWEASGFPVVR